MLSIIAQPVVDPARLDEVKAAMLELVEDTLKEPGCIRYELHQDSNQPNRLTFVELWESRELWVQHMSGEAIQRFNAQIAGGIIDFELQEMERIS